MAATNDPDELPSVEQALATLQAAIKAAQLKNQLTGLPNKPALQEYLTEKVESEQPFWIAFIEIDLFKEVNDRFGHAKADVLLIMIADILRELAATQKLLPFHPHGDEFYLASQNPDSSAAVEAIHGLLDELRSRVAAISESIQGFDEPLCCTVSVGWVLSEDCLDLEKGLSRDSVLFYLEKAVEHAKYDRDVVLKFEPEMLANSKRSGRANCESCNARIYLSIQEAELRDGDITCSNCGSAITRPTALQPAGMGDRRRPGL